jgi:hypothetical protein
VDDFPISVSVLNALNHLAAVEEEFHLAAFLPDEHCHELVARLLVPYLEVAVH